MKKKSLIISLILLLGIVVAYERKQQGDEWDRGFHRLSLDYEDGGVSSAQKEEEKKNNEQNGASPSNFIQPQINTSSPSNTAVNNNQNQENISPASPEKADVSKSAEPPQPALDLFSE